jgi:hypothetical protein
LKLFLHPKGVIVGFVARIGHRFVQIKAESEIPEYSKNVEEIVRSRYFAPERILE